jgi:SGF29 tudor-like domain
MPRASPKASIPGGSTKGNKSKGNSKTPPTLQPAGLYPQHMSAQSHPGMMYHQQSPGNNTPGSAAFGQHQLIAAAAAAAAAASTGGQQLLQQPQQFNGSTQQHLMQIQQQRLRHLHQQNVASGGTFHETSQHQQQQQLSQAHHRDSWGSLSSVSSVNNTKGVVGPLHRPPATSLTKGMIGAGSAGKGGTVGAVPSLLPASPNRNPQQHQQQTQTALGPLTSYPSQPSAPPAAPSTKSTSKSKTKPSSATQKAVSQRPASAPATRPSDNKTGSVASGSTGNAKYASLARAASPGPPSGTLPVSAPMVRMDAINTDAQINLNPMLVSQEDTAVFCQLTQQCHWIDRTLWASRQILGGQGFNGFLKATATVQRIKKQRARQSAQSRKKETAGGDGGALAQAFGTSMPTLASSMNNALAGLSAKASGDIKKRAPDLSPEQLAEEELKKDVLNVRTAKKIKAELESGLHFCALVHGVVRTVLQEMGAVGVEGGIDPVLMGIDSVVAGPPYPPGCTIFPPPPPLGPELPNPKASRNLQQLSGSAVPSALIGDIVAAQPMTTAQATTKAKNLPMTTSSSSLTNKAGLPKQTPMALQRRPSASSQATATSTSARTAGAISTLRKHRKKKVPPSEEPPIIVPEVDSTGKRIGAKKDHAYKLFELLRFRPLRQGDSVAARLDSRDLWIVARVQKDYAGPPVPSAQFLQMTASKRDQLFRAKVLVIDAEDPTHSGGTLVPRSAVLPLPRSFGEAADWAQRYKKGSRVYALYPETTSLYPAIVVDSSTYCRDDDDIIVVEFDDDEPDGSTGLLPQCHIPSRFVTLIPKEFSSSTTVKTRPASNASRNKNGSTAAASSNTTAAKGSSKPTDIGDPLNDMLLFEDLDGLDDLDFDLLEDS